MLGEESGRGPSVHLGMVPFKGKLGEIPKGVFKLPMCHAGDKNESQEYPRHRDLDRQERDIEEAEKSRGIILCYAHLNRSGREGSELKRLFASFGFRSRNDR